MNVNTPSTVLTSVFHDHVRIDVDARPASTEQRLQVIQPLSPLSTMHESRNSTATCASPMHRHEPAFMTNLNSQNVMTPVISYHRLRKPQAHSPLSSLTEESAHRIKSVSVADEQNVAAPATLRQVMCEYLSRSLSDIKSIFRLTQPSITELTSAMSGDSYVISDEAKQVIMQHIYHRGNRVMLAYFTMLTIFSITIAPLRDRYWQPMLFSITAIIIFAIAIKRYPLRPATRILSAAIAQCFCLLFLYEYNQLETMLSWYFISSTVSIVYEDWITQMFGTIILVTTHTALNILTSYGVSTLGDYTLSLQLFTIVIQGVVCSYWAFLQMQQSLSDAQQRVRLTQMNEAKSLFLSTMSHELRTPLQGVLGMIEMQLETKMTTEQIEMAEAVRSSGQALLSLVNDILDFSKVEAGKLQLEIIPMDLHRVCEVVMDLLSLHAASKGIHLVLRYAPNTPRLIRSDPSRIRQICLNLIGNAIKFCLTGFVLVNVELADELIEINNNNIISTPTAVINRYITVHGAKTVYRTIPGSESRMIRISVIDSGIGIDSKQLETLFTPFSQADSSTSRRFGGSGLGLAISRRLCDLASGTLTVASVPGSGSTFTCILPVQIDLNSASESQSRRSIQSSTPPHPVVTNAQIPNVVNEEINELLSTPATTETRLHQPSSMVFLPPPQSQALSLHRTLIIVCHELSRAVLHEMLQHFGADVSVIHSAVEPFDRSKFPPSECPLLIALNRITQSSDRSNMYDSIIVDAETTSLDPAVWFRFVTALRQFERDQASQPLSPIKLIVTLNGRIKRRFEDAYSGEHVYYVTKPAREAALIHMLTAANGTDEYVSQRSLNSAYNVSNATSPLLLKGRSVRTSVNDARLNVSDSTNTSNWITAAPANSTLCVLSSNAVKKESSSNAATSSVTSNSPSAVLSPLIQRSATVLYQSAHPLQGIEENLAISLTPLPLLDCSATPPPLHRVFSSTAPINNLLPVTPSLSFEIPSPQSLLQNGKGGQRSYSVEQASPTSGAALLSPSTSQHSAMAAPSLSRSVSGSGLPQLNAHILIVDDQIINQRVVAKLVERLQCTYDLAVNGAEAVRLACVIPQPYGLVLMDLHMPIMNGYEAATEIRRWQKLNGIPAEQLPIVALSADTLPEVHQQCLDAGMDGFLNKPVVPKLLAAKIKQWTKRAQDFTQKSISRQNTTDKLQTE